jgi:predicted RNA-binding protein with PUA-like domain
MKTWLVKQEPETYPWSQFVRDKGTRWEGVRNYQARNHLRAMSVGDHVLYYHSGGERAVVGVARVTKEAYPDPTAPGEDWSVVDLAPIKAFAHPVSLAAVKAEKKLQDIPLVRQSRLSVMPLSSQAFELLVAMGQSK